MVRRLLEPDTNTNYIASLRKRMRNANKNVYCKLRGRQLHGVEHKFLLFSYANTGNNAIMRQQRNADKNLHAQLRRRQLRAMGRVHGTELSFQHKARGQPSVRQLRHTNKNRNV